MYSGEPAKDEQRAWWERRLAVALLMVAATIPLLWPDIPPLVDLPGHMGRYAVQLNLDSSPHLQQYYRFEWMLIGNLGVDLLVVPLASIFGLELATKLIVVAIPAMTVGGLLWVAREVHGRVPPTALFAVPLAYNFPFSFGFVNFALSMAFALLAFALWLRLARIGKLRLRAILFVPISLLVWVTHAFGWGTLGVMAFSAELIRQHDMKRSWIQSAFNAGIQVLTLTPPILLMLLWRNSAVAGSTGDWFNWRAKLGWFFMALRDRWLWFDLGSLIVIVVLILRAIHSKRIGFSRNLAASALFLLLVYIMLPRIVFGSAYADMRLVPYMLAVAVIAIRIRPGQHPLFAPAIAVVALLFTATRLGATTASYYLYDQDYDRELAALNHVPRGARMVSFVGSSCRQRWKMSRLEHLPALAMVRREAFSNDQWSMAGAQLLLTDYPPGGGFVRDPSQIVSDVQCRREIWRSLDASLRDLPRDAFDYVWLIQPPRHDAALLAGLQPIWRSGPSVLYRIADRTPPGGKNVVAEERE